MDVLLVISLILAIVALAVAGFATFRVETRVRELERRLEMLDRQHQEAGEGLESLSGRLDAQSDQLAGQLRDLRRLRDQLTTLSQRDTGDGVFQQAIRLAGRGASREDIMASCGLSAVEADLVLLLHRQS